MTTQRTIHLHALHLTAEIRADLTPEDLLRVLSELRADIARRHGDPAEPPPRAS